MSYIDIENHRFTNEFVGPDHCDVCGQSASVHREFLGSGDWTQNPDGTYSPSVPLGLIGPANWREWFRGLFR